MSKHILDQGSIQRMINKDSTISPILQVIDFKKIISPTTGERFRMVLSDGQLYIQALLGLAINDLGYNGQLKRYTIICLKEFECNVASGKPICIVNQCDVVQQNNQVIGKPQNTSAVITKEVQQAPQNNVNYIESIWQSLNNM